MWSKVSVPKRCWLASMVIVILSMSDRWLAGGERMYPPSRQRGKGLKLFLGLEVLAGNSFVDQVREISEGREEVQEF